MSVYSLNSSTLKLLNFVVVQFYLRQSRIVIRARRAGHSENVFEIVRELFRSVELEALYS
jgi:hypothetical protein